MSTDNINTAPLPSAGFKGSNLPPLVTNDPPRVLIAGAGLAGLFLGILLEMADIPYEIFERTAEIKPLGKDLLLNYTSFSSTPLLLRSYIFLDYVFPTCRCDHVTGISSRQPLFCLFVLVDNDHTHARRECFLS